MGKPIKLLLGFVVVGLAGTAALPVGSFAAEGGGRSGSFEQQIRRAQATVAKIDQMIQSTSAMLTAARSRGDMIKVAAVNDSLIQLNGMANLAQQALGQMQLAAARGDSQGVQHAAARLAVIEQKATVTFEQAQNAVGEELHVTDGEPGGSVEVDVDPSVPEDDPGRPASDLPGSPVGRQPVERPVTASPF